MEKGPKSTPKFSKSFEPFSGAVVVLYVYFSGGSSSLFHSSAIDEPGLYSNNNLYVKPLFP